MMKLVEASALVLIRRAPDLQILMVRRAENQRAFPGHWTFPGGALDAADGALAQEGLADAASRHCALRELFEETGVLPGYAGDWAGLGDDRQALLANQLGWGDFCARRNYLPPIATLEFIGLRVTPPIMPRLFETHYYLLELAADEACEPLAFSPEMAEGGWKRPDALYQLWLRSQALLPAPVLEVIKALRAEAIDLAMLRAQANSRDSVPIPIELYPGIEMFPLRTPTLAPATHTNGYLIGGERFVIIDPASPYPDQQEVLRQVLQRRLDAGDRPLAVLLTHHHRDHVGGATFVRDWLGVPIRAHADTAALIDFEIDQAIEDGESWDLGQDELDRPWRVEAMFTPGHAPGHLCFIDRREGVTVVGDMLAGFGTILIKRPRGDMGKYLASLQRMADDPGISRGLPAHGPIIPALRARCLEYIQHRRMRELRVLEALAQGPLTEAEVLSFVYSDIDPQALPLARWALDAHLAHMEQEGEIGQVDGFWRLTASI